MYAIISAGGKQYRVENGSVLKVEKLNVEEGTTVKFDVLLLNKDGALTVGAPIVEGAYAEATVPKVTLVLRKAYGGAYIAMGSKFLRGDFNFAFPSAEIAVMGPRGAVEILYSRDLKKETDPDKQEEMKQKLTKEYSDKFASPYQAARNGSIDEIIEPAEARAKIINAFKILKSKRDPKKHPNTGNIPL